jgi:hypothetical protein
MIFDTPPSPGIRPAAVRVHDQSEKEANRQYDSKFKTTIMNSTTCKTFTAIATIGLIRGYSKQSITLAEFKSALLQAQQEIHEHFNISLSVKVTECEILFLGQEEPSVELQFIQYPKFPQEGSVLQKAIVELIELIMIELDQNRVVIVFNDETIMLEQSDIIDPNIKL